MVLLLPYYHHRTGESSVQRQNLWQSGAPWLVQKLSSSQECLRWLWLRAGAAQWGCSRSAGEEPSSLGGTAPNKVLAGNSWHGRDAPSARSQHFSLPLKPLGVSQLWASNSPAGPGDTGLCRVQDQPLEASSSSAWNLIVSVSSWRKILWKWSGR